MKRLTLVFLASVCTFAIAAEEETPRPDQELIQGTWKIVALKGSEAPEGNKWRGGVITFTADTMTIKPLLAKNKEEWTRLSYTLDPGQEPKHLDTRHRLGRDEKPIVQLGIYSLDKDRLRFGLNSAGESRPATFDEIPLVFELERAKLGEKGSASADKL